MTEQFELVTMKPPDCLRQDCISMSLRWSALISGMTSGTCGCMRKADELEMTAQPASANAGSMSRAISASSAAKMTLGAPLGSAAESCMEAIPAGMGVFIFHFAASS
jgi:hypothetical protein